MKKNRNKAIKIKRNASKWCVYFLVFVCGIILIVFSQTICKGSLVSVLLSIGAGLVSSGLTAYFVDYANYLDFMRKRRYRRTIELDHLSFSMITVAQSIIGESNNRSIPDIIEKLSKIQVNDDNFEQISLAIQSQRDFIKKELQTVYRIQDYLSLSGFFEEQEITFLCRSINYYGNDLSNDRVQTIINNIVNYLNYFSDTVK